MNVRSKEPLASDLLSIGSPLAHAAAIADETAARHAEDVDRHGRFPRETVDALRGAGLLSVAVPSALGGGGADWATLAGLARTLGRACASSGMVFAMHTIQVAAIRAHARDTPALADYLRSVVREQRLIGSVTSEVGTGGDLRSSRTHIVALPGDRFSVDKATTASSYVEFADDLLLTARRGPESSAGDQVAVLLCGGGFRVEDVGEWDTLGMRGTCSPPARVVGEGAGWQILPDPFRDVAQATMVPVSHLLWSAVWLGIAEDAVRRARRFVRIRSRKDPDGDGRAADRLAEAALRLAAERARLDAAVDVHAARPEGEASAVSVGDVIAINELKLGMSEAVPAIVEAAMRAIGIAAYRNAGEWSLGRHLRDAHSAALMIHNDRIRRTNADLLLVHKGE